MRYRSIPQIAKLRKHTAKRPLHPIIWNGESLDPPLEGLDDDGSGNQVPIGQCQKETIRDYMVKL